MVESLETKFLSGTTLGNRRLRLTIAGVKKMPLRDPKTGQTEKKPVLGFTNGQLLALNKINRQVLRDALGDDPLKWIGAVVEVRTESTSMGPGVRNRRQAAHLFGVANQRAALDGVAIC